MRVTPHDQEIQKLTIRLFLQPISPAWRLSQIRYHFGKYAEGVEDERLI